MKYHFLAVFLGSILSTVSLVSGDSLVTEASGLDKVEFLTDITAIEPGEPFWVGMQFTPADTFHVYWKGPGIVGVEPSFTWDLPNGFQTSEVYWPPPGIVDMAGIRANGYKEGVCLLTKITPPVNLSESTVTLKVRCGWMACSTTCHPGMHDFAMTLPVATEQKESPLIAKISDLFESVLATIPPKAPDTWTINASRQEETMTLEVTIPNFTPTKKQAGVHFFCHDMQVDSDQDQASTLLKDKKHTLQQRMIIPDFAPRNPKNLSGLLYSPTGWPGIENHWVEILVPSPLASSHE